MAQRRYRGLTWDNPRGYGPLRHAAARDQDLHLEWDVQPLEGFESHPIDDLARRYDVLVIDHPGIGEAAAASALRPLEQLFDTAERASWATDSIGRSYASYTWEGHQYALPIDAAAQVCAYRPQHLGDLDGDLSWAQVEDLMTRKAGVLSLAGPHALCTYLSILAGLDPHLSNTPEHLFGSDDASTAFDIQRRLANLSVPSLADANPIAILAAMTHEDGPALCPLVFGYVSAVVPGVRFRDAPVGRTGGRPGSTLGGTGIALSAFREVGADLVDHLRFLMSRKAQVEMVPAHHGQPSARDAWTNNRVNAACDDFFRRTAATVEHAYVRPRFAGYIGFQLEASEILRDAITSNTSAMVALAKLRAAYHAAKSHKD